MKITVLGCNGPRPTKESGCSGCLIESGSGTKVVVDLGAGTLTELLDRYFLVIDPLSINRQGGDMGIQYRTGIYWVSPAQLPEIEERVRKEAEALGVRRLEVELKPLENFYPAEEYHQKYLDKNPGGYCHIPRRYFDLNAKERD